MKVSFILPAYKAKFLSLAIDSILSQSYGNFELIIVDDHSPEDIKGIVDRYNDDRITYYRNAVNIGGKSLVQQWNHCIEFASGDYLVLAADDDVYEPDFLKEMISLVQKHPKVDVLRARVKEIDEEGKLLGLDGMIAEYCSMAEYIYHWRRATIMICIGNYMFKTATIKEKKFIDFPSAFCSDIASIINLAAAGVVNSSDYLFNFRKSTIHLSSSNTQLEKKLEANNQFYEWMLSLQIPLGNTEIDRFIHAQISEDNLLEKCRYDYYNQIFKFLPVGKLSLIENFKFLSNKQKFKMIFRYFFDKIFR